MEQGTLQIIISSIIAFVAILSFVFNIRNNKKIKELKESKEELAKAIKTLSRHTPNYSYRIKRQVKEFHLDGNGNAVIQSLWDGLEPFQEFSNLKIPYTFTAEGNGVRISKPVVIELNDSDYPVVMRDLKFRSNGKDYSEYKGNFTILGHCSTSDCKIGFKCTQEVEKGYTSTKKEAQQRYKNTDWENEYCASKVLVPMDELELAIIFPYELKELSGKPYPVCFVSGTHTIHIKETEIIQNGFEYEFDKKATLRVKDPTPGLTYAISWMPPDSEVN
ncbi:hypothetical protein [Pseudozobellia sp. WGM2]|uniref:hypothetical protein n=1 Tax=Pseudozobellia sp. WGM2 TaxID=2787625 RepID=UPI001ADF9137|nr:hypothetical protein [Pseudozobellia sp. WGM2]